MNFEHTYGTKDVLKLAKWFTHDDGGSFLIAPVGNPVQIEENLKLLKASGKEEEEKSLYEAKLTSCHILSKAILLDWKDVVHNDGSEHKYTSEAGAKVLYSYDEFRDWVVKHATALTNVNEERKEELLKNS